MGNFSSNHGFSVSHQLCAPKVALVALSQCPEIFVDRAIKGKDVVNVLERLRFFDGRIPKRIQIDNGSELISKTLDKWAYENEVVLDFSRPGKPTDIGINGPEELKLDHKRRGAQGHQTGLFKICPDTRYSMDGFFSLKSKITLYGIA